MSFDKLCQLMGTASPYSRLVTNDKDTAELIEAGFICEDDKGFAITPSGLRALADQMEAGHVATAICKLVERRELKKSQRKR